MFQQALSVRVAARPTAPVAFGANVPIAALVRFVKGISPTADATEAATRTANLAETNASAASEVTRARVLTCHVTQAA